MSVYRTFHNPDEYLTNAPLPGSDEIAEVNAHLHSPYSFSAFETVRQAVEKAVSEGVMVAGINDFNTMDGHAEWAHECLREKVFPLFNIEFIALDRTCQKNGMLVNDPNNPGRVYLSGKGLAYPQIIKGKSLERLNSIRSEANRHVERLCEKLNNHLSACGSPFTISFREVLATLTRGNIRERHLARALRIKTETHFSDIQAQSAFYEKIFKGKPLISNPLNAAAIENEIRSNLLKSGGPAFVPENTEAFPEVEDICRLITDAGGIPTYPFLADNAGGNFTDFERDLEKSIDLLRRMNICSVEFIPARNSLNVLERYACFFNENGFIVTFGTEHNTPVMEPLKVHASGGTELTPVLKEISYMGACVIAAHQYLTAVGRTGYHCAASGRPDMNGFIRLGHALIRSVTNN